MNVTITFHCPSCKRDGFVKIIGGEAPAKVICPACGRELADVQVDYEDSTIYMSRVGDPTDWNYAAEEGDGR